MRETILIVLIMVSVGLLITGCSDYTKDEKKVYDAILDYQKKNFKKSNKKLKVVYPKLKEIPPNEFIEGRTTEGNDFWMVRGVITYDQKKVPGEEHLDRDGRSLFDATVEKVKGKYVVTYYTEQGRFRKDLDK